jgi:hypothetical protein
MTQPTISFAAKNYTATLTAANQASPLLATINKEPISKTNSYIINTIIKQSFSDFVKNTIIAMKLLDTKTTDAMEHTAQSFANKQLGDSFLKKITENLQVIAQNVSPLIKAAKQSISSGDTYLEGNNIDNALIYYINAMTNIVNASKNAIQPVKNLNLLKTALGKGSLSFPTLAANLESLKKQSIPLKNTINASASLKKAMKQTFLKQISTIANTFETINDNITQAAHIVIADPVKSSESAHTANQAIKKAQRQFQRINQQIKRFGKTPTHHH